MKNLETIATELAIEAVAGDYDDFGALYDDDGHGHLSENEWQQVCDMADAMRETVHVPDSLRAAAFQAAIEYRACERAENFVGFGCCE